VDWPPEGLAKTMWAMFYGIVLWEKGSTGNAPDIDLLKPMLDSAFNVFERGVRK
jgi:hypothetical protein